MIKNMGKVKKLGKTVHIMKVNTKKVKNMVKEDINGVMDHVI